MGFHIIGFQLQCRFKLPHRFVEPARRGQHAPIVVVVCGGCGLQPEREFELGRGLRGMTGREQHAGPVGVRLRVGGFEPESGLELRLRLLHPPGPR